VSGHAAPQHDRAARLLYARKNDAASRHHPKGSSDAPPRHRHVQTVSYVLMASVTIEAIAACPQFRHLSTIGGIATDLRYATDDNFFRRNLYAPLDCAWLHCDAAYALERVVAWLAARHPDYMIVIFDALRPQRVQEQLWQALQGTPLQRYIADPKRGSVHSFGMAVDITLIDGAGHELDMGTAFDDLSELSHPALEQLMLERGAISLQQVENRQLLRDAMAHGGWRGIRTEWWHFDCGDSALVRNNYARVL
jgi:zinc D-Ala-D-Ala dipeptidase